MKKPKPSPTKALDMLRRERVEISLAEAENLISGIEIMGRYEGNPYALRMAMRRNRAALTEIVEEFREEKRRIAREALGVETLTENTVVPAEAMARIRDFGSSEVEVALWQVPYDLTEACQWPDNALHGLMVIPDTLYEEEPCEGEEEPVRVRGEINGYEWAEDTVQG